MPQDTKPVNMTDHDLLIRVDTVVQRLALDVAKTNDGLTSRIAALEAAKIGYDQIVAEYPPSKAFERIAANERWINEFKLTWKIMLAISGGIGALVSFIGTILLIATNIVHLTH